MEHDDKCDVCGHTNESNPIKEYHHFILGLTKNELTVKDYGKPPICHKCYNDMALDAMQETENIVNMKKMGDFQRNNV